MLLLFVLTALRAAGADNSQAVTLEAVAWGLQKPVAMADDGTGRIFIAEQRGTIRLLEDGRLARNPVLDLSANVEPGSECGLLGFALHPDFQRNGLIYVNYTTRNLRPVAGVSGSAPPAMQTVVAEYVVEPRTLVVEPKQTQELLRFDQPFPNHEGGDLKFGPDGMLYVSTGDGGDHGDPMNNAQNLGNLLGKILRLDVSGKKPGAIPPDNPFVGMRGARGEIWAYGLHDPRRFSFDRVTGELYTGDTGDGTWEEIDLIEKGKNYGWSGREGMHDYKTGRTPPGTTIDPIKEYGRSTGGSVIGGYVYRGKLFPWLDGMYLYADADAQRVFGLRRVGVRFDAALVRAAFPIRAFGEDHDGELYVLNFEGELYRLVVTDQATRKKSP